MKKSIKAIATAILMGAMAAGLCFGLAGCSSSSTNTSSLLGTDQFDRQYIASSNVTGLTGVHNIKVYWYGKGTVNVENTNDSTLSFKEDGADGLEQDAIMHYTNNDDTLIIRSAQLNYDDVKDAASKTLTIYVPYDADIQYLEINATKSTVNVNADNCKQAVETAKAADK